MEGWNVCYDLQPKCQCFTLVRGERRAHGGGGSGEEFRRVHKSHTPKMLLECVGEGEKVRLEMTEGKKERQAACVFMLRRD